MQESGSPRLLDPYLLGELQARWEAQGAFVARALLGITDPGIDELTEPIGLRLPREARRWWAWYDGALPQPAGIAAELGPRRAFLPLAEAVMKCEMFRDVLREVGDDPVWKQSWLPIDADKRPIVLDCSVGFEDPVPVRSFFVEDPTAGEEGVRSIGELVEIWIDAIDRGAWSYNRQRDLWGYDWTRLDRRVSLLHLA
jgi:hypothetical protein